ncbi:unnamed protein product [Spodoptera exigua]|uniref:Uncharacterized protein n=1 Tax=Spodoptera exigua TaxID=7107 RepID=A0A922M5N0_SPOEX|nr:hypothetical protein HF086_001007 [Spodoptera exigua]CAH0690033.1 unnamed protein product [Spodoptera exigua]
MNKDKRKSNEMVATKNKNKVLSCSTPDRADSPSRDSDSICDSEAASPVPFLCTQDGAEGETDVVWNFYTPKSENAAKSRIKNSTPVSRRSKRSIKPKIIERQPPKRRALKQSLHKKTELFQELMELNQNLVELMSKKTQNKCTEKVNSASEDDCMSESPEFSPKSRVRSNSRCLRRNVLSSNFVKPDPEAALESDDSMNECLIKASQVVEENILNEAPPLKRPCYESKIKKNVITDLNFKMDNDSMDAILNSIKLESPVVKKVQKCSSPQLNNDSFDSLVGNLNDSALERLTQMPTKLDTSHNKSKPNSSKDSWMIKELIVHDASPSSKSIFSRHSSMPVSPTVMEMSKPSTSGMVFGRYNSMPFGKEKESSTDQGDSPIRCTPEEIKKKHQLAREKLLAKRLLPFTSSQKASQSIFNSQLTQQPLPKINEESVTNLPKTGVPKKVQFQPKIASSAILQNKPMPNVQQKPISNSVDLKTIIERKRQEALMKLRRRQIQSK